MPALAVANPLHLDLPDHPHPTHPAHPAHPTRAQVSAVKSGVVPTPNEKNHGSTRVCVIPEAQRPGRRDKVNEDQARVLKAPG